MTVKHMTAKERLTRVGDRGIETKRHRDAKYSDTDRQRQKRDVETAYTHQRTESGVPRSLVRGLSSWLPAPTSGWISQYTHDQERGRDGVEGGAGQT